MKSDRKPKLKVERRGKLKSKVDLTFSQGIISNSKGQITNLCCQSERLLALIWVKNQLKRYSVLQPEG